MDGLVRVGEEVEAEKLEALGVDQWVTGPWAGQQHSDNLSKLKLYAYACKQQLGENIETDKLNLMKNITCVARRPICFRNQLM